MDDAGGITDGGAHSRPRDAAAAAVARRRRSLRATGRRARAQLTDEARATATVAVVERLVRLPELADVRRVLVTAAVGDELDLTELVDRLRARGTIVALPVVDGDALVPVDLVDGHQLTPGWREVPEPVGAPSPGPVDVVVVPALVLDRRGGRLGYGGGHFDRYLAGPAAAAVSVGAVFHGQLVTEVPVMPHDVTLDIVVTDGGVWRAGSEVPPG